MISIIICSRKKTLSKALSDNIKQTIGTAFEIIVIDNSESRYSIFEAYNIGVKKSRYPYLCFMHDDIKYYTHNWGLIVLEHFKGDKVGAIGIAGTPYMPYLPGSWWCSNLVNMHILQNNMQINERSSHKYPPATGTRNKVSVLDGVWFCIAKRLFADITFDEVNYSGFHFYDIDISMQVGRAGYDLFCVFDIVVEHFSNGNVDKKWQENAFVFNRKWRSVLPAACIPISYSSRCEAELRTLQEFTKILITNGLSPKKAYRTAFFTLLKYANIYFQPKTIAHLCRYSFKSIF